MKVLHITNAYPLPDVPEFGVFVKEQIAALNCAGLQADVVFVNGRGEGKTAYLKAVQEVRERAPGYDVVHCHHLYSAFVAALARVRVPVVASFQNAWLHEVEIPFKPLQTALCSIGVHYADRVIFKSPIPPQFRGNKKFIHLPNGVNENEFYITSKAEARARLGLDPVAAYLLFVSSKTIDRPQKRYDRFEKTLALVRAAHPDHDIRELVMVNQQRSRVLDFFNAADLHLLCSDYEGSPNSVKEALCTGLPVVSTDVGNVREMLEGVPCSFVAEPMEPATLAELVTHSLAGACERDAVRVAFLAKGFSQEAATQRLIALYADLAPGV